jgi:hypothetical protein
MYKLCVDSTLWELRFRKLVAGIRILRKWFLKKNRVFVG